MTDVDRFYELMMDHRGKQNAIVAREIAHELGIERGSSSVNIRKLKTKVIDQYRIPIAGNPGLGYYVMETQQELAETIASLNKRINNTAQLIVKTMRHYAHFHNQDDLELGPEIIGPDDEDEDE